MTSEKTMLRAVNGEAAQPLAQVVAAGAKDEPLVAEKRHGDGDDVGEQAGYLRTVDAERGGRDS